jgi:basic membrane lipoprotein Med (substrate-binding protein (PBP1-ABC) superfamily)
VKIQYRAVESRQAADYLPNMASLARAGFNIVISAGFLLNDATEAVAISSRTRSSRSRTTGRGVQEAHSNIEGLTYATNQNSYLIGCLAAKVAAGRGRRTSAWSADRASRRW